MARLFADLHCHPTLFNFNRMRNDPDQENDPRRFHPWEVKASNPEHMARGQRANTYSQCDMAKLTRGDVRLVFASITPIEVGFVEPRREDDDLPFTLEYLRLASGLTLAEVGASLLRGDRKEAGFRIARLLRNKGPLRMMLQNAIMRYGMRRIRFFLSRDYDYWEEFWREYDFYKRDDGVRQSAEIVYGDGRTERVTGRYHLVRDVDMLRRIIDDDDSDELAVVMTVEGGHIFSVAPGEREVDLATMLRRIEALRELEHPLFFITFAHHFDNHLCGHAHSLIDAASWTVDQRPRMNEGFNPECGQAIARALLDLDDDLVDRGRGRILLDSKHMSARTRREYYRDILEPYLAHHANLSDADQARFPKIPLIMSHVGYSGVPTLEAMIANEGREDDNWRIQGFYAWNINACDEDVRMLHATEGLFGLCFDQRICGVGPREVIPPEGWAEILWRNIVGFVDVIMLDDRLSPDQKRTIWDRICIGSDFDGLIDPVSAYPTALDLHDFAQDLGELLETHKHTRMIDDIGVEAIVDKICWKNAYAFTCKHLAAARPSS